MLLRLLSIKLSAGRLALPCGSAQANIPCRLVRDMRNSRHVLFMMITNPYPGLEYIAACQLRQYAWLHPLLCPMPLCLLWRLLSLYER